MIEMMSRGYGNNGDEYVFVGSVSIEGGGGWYDTRNWKRAPDITAHILDCLYGDEVRHLMAITNDDDVIDDALAVFEEEDSSVTETYDPGSETEGVGYDPDRTELDYDNVGGELWSEEGGNSLAYYPVDIDEAGDDDNTELPLGMVA
jgi:hypothetical protein